MFDNRGGRKARLSFLGHTYETSRCIIYNGVSVNAYQLRQG